MWALKIAVLVVCVLTGVGYLSRTWWVFDLACHFRLQYACLLLLAVFLCLWKRKVLIAIPATLALVANLVTLAPTFLESPAQGTGGQHTLRIAFLNARVENRDYDRFLSWVQEEAPDLLVVGELTSEWASGIGELEAAYPHRLMEPRAGHFGIGLYSKRALLKASIETFDGEAMPTILAGIADDDGKTHHLTLVGLHAFAPVRSWATNTRNQHLMRLARHLSATGGAQVVIGDFNTTPFSWIFDAFAETSGLRSASRGFGWLPTWPNPYAPVMIPIDHAFVSPSIEVVRFRRGPHCGSDHNSIVLDIKL